MGGLAKIRGGVALHQYDHWSSIYYMLYCMSYYAYIYHIYYSIYWRTNQDQGRSRILPVWSMIVMMMTTVAMVMIVAIWWYYVRNSDDGDSDDGSEEIELVNVWNLPKCFDVYGTFIICSWSKREHLRFCHQIRGAGLQKLCNKVEL